MVDQLGVSFLYLLFVLLLVAVTVVAVVLATAMGAIKKHEQLLSTLLLDAAARNGKPIRRTCAACGTSFLGPGVNADGIGIVCSVDCERYVEIVRKAVSKGVITP